MLCQQTMVTIPWSEHRQFCKGSKACRGTGTIRCRRVLPPDERFVRSVRVYSTDGDNLAERVRSMVEHFPDEDGVPEEDGEVMDVTSREVQVPLEVCEPVVSATTVSEDSYTVFRIVNADLHGSQYRVKWVCDKTKVHSMTWEPVTCVTNAAESVVDYWQSTAGRNKAKEIATVCKKEVFRYDEWRKLVLSADARPQRLVAYVLTVQLVSTPQRTQNALKQQLDKGTFASGTTFRVWVVPASLSCTDGSLAVPLNCSIDEITRLVEPSEWTTVMPRLVKHVRRRLLSTGIPIFWWHSEDQDLQWGYTRVDAEGVPLDTILRFGTADYPPTQC